MIRETPTERTLYCVRPQFFQLSDEIERDITSAGLSIAWSKTVWLTEEDLRSIYVDETPSPYLEATFHYMTRGFSRIGVVTGSGAVQRLLEISGASHIPGENDASTIRARYGFKESLEFKGVRYYLNPIHRSCTVSEASTGAEYADMHILSRSSEQIVSDMRRQLHRDAQLMCVYDHHVTQVVAIADTLCDKFGGDREVIRMAAWLHDITSLTAGSKTDHHLTGAKKAGSILRILHHDEMLIARVQHCIKMHRGGPKPSENCSLEAEIVRSADGIANLRSPLLLYYFAFARKGLSFDEGKARVLAKVESSFGKVSEFAQEYAQDEYTQWQAQLR